MLSSDVRKLFAFAKQVERLSDPEEIIPVCLDSGVASFRGTIDYESSYSAKQRREWDLFILFMVRYIRWPAYGADEHVCWLKRRGYQTPSEWMGEEGDKYRKKYGGWLVSVSDQAKQWWKDLLAQTADFDRVAINKIIAEEDRALEAEIAAARTRKAATLGEAKLGSPCRGQQESRARGQKFATIVDLLRCPIF